MSLLAIGVSHRSAPLTVLERVALDGEGVRRLSGAVLASDQVAEAVVLATCNRVEVYADVATFHGGLAELGEALSASTGVPLTELTDHLYVHYADRAVAHLFAVACGLDSMAVGESQVLGQLRTALRSAQESGDAGRVLDHLVQQALRVGKRAHAETGIDRAGASLVDAALTRAEALLGPLDGLDVLVVGAGSMSALAATAVHRAGVRSVTVANRTPEHAARLAGAVGGVAVPLAELPSALAHADLVVSCTGAVGHVLDTATVAAASATRPSGAGPQLYVDLALPRDVDPAVAALAGVHVVDLAVLGSDLAGRQLGVDLDRVRALVDQEVSAYLVARRVQAVAPTVAALRARAAEVVTAELGRLEQRLPDVDAAVREEVQRTVHRVVEKLLHAPTVRVKELASRTDGGSYELALRELFDLDPQGVAAVSDVPTGLDVGRVTT
ncbi:MAG TPA: glutamyl-tRNA reductase [Actinomycetales bacterium]|jgi:glutamyl-tRNA reductase